MTPIIITIVANAYALVWLVPHVMVILISYLAITCEFGMLLTLISLLISCGSVEYKTRTGFTKWLHKIFLRSFNGVSLIRLDLAGTKNKPVMYCFHPHAMVANGFGLGMLSTLNTSGRPLTIAVARSLYWLNPVFKWLVNSHGIDMCTVSRTDLQREMARGRSIGLCPGGFEEALLVRQGTDVVFLEKRTGFLRLACDFSYTVVQAFTFGESQIYENILPLSPPLKRMAARCGIPLVWPGGDSWVSFNPIPPHMGLRIVFGEPIATPQADTKSAMYDILHKTYINRLLLLHARFNPYMNFRLVVL
jgi:hypothetical protein